MIELDNTRRISTDQRRCPKYLLLWRCQCGRMWTDEVIVDANNTGYYRTDCDYLRYIERNVRDEFMGAMRDPFFGPRAQAYDCDVCKRKAAVRLRCKLEAWQDAERDAENQPVNGDAAGKLLKKAVLAAEPAAMVRGLRAALEHANGNYILPTGYAELIHVQLIGWQVTTTHVDELDVEEPQ